MVIYVNGGTLTINDGSALSDAAETAALPAVNGGFRERGRLGGNNNGQITGYPLGPTAARESEKLSQNFF